MIDRTSAGSWASSVARLATSAALTVSCTARNSKRSSLIDHLRVPITAADLAVEAGEIDTVGGGKALDHLLAHMAATEIGEDAERHAFRLVGRQRCEHPTVHRMTRCIVHQHSGENYL